MIWNEEKERYEFTSGRNFEANGFIGIVDCGGNGVAIAQGYDGHIHIKDKDNDEDYDYDPLTIEERTELADYMIALWTKFKDVNTKIN